MKTSENAADFEALLDDIFKRDDIRAKMGFDIVIALSKNGYPPVGNNYEEVYQQVIEQAENFKKNFD